MDVINGIVFLIAYINALRKIGLLVTKKAKFFRNLIVGYITYYVLQFILGFIFQLASLPLNIYYIIMGVVLLAANVLSLVDLIRALKNPSASLHKVGEHIQNYWIIYVLSAVLLYISVIYAPGHWLSNNLDDGYYVMKVINFVDGININIDPATGFVDHSSFMTWIARVVNTVELDLASYCYLFKIDVLVFLNYFYTWFNYFFILVCIVEFFETVFEKKSRKMIVYGSVGILFFALYPEVFEKLEIGIQDAWQFNTAIWYGSSICRIPAMFILFIGLFEYKGQYLKQILYFVACSITFMSKGTQILPVLVFTGFIYCLNWLWERKVNLVIKILPIPLFALASIVFDKVISYTDSVGANIVSIVQSDYKNPLIIAIFVLFVVLMAINYKNKKLLMWNFIICFFALFSYVDQLNDVLTTFSIYYFVAARATTLIFFTLVMTEAYEVADLLGKLKVPGKVVLITGNLTACLLFMAVSTYLMGGRNALSYVYHNPKLTYNTVLSLSEYLNKLDEENGDEEVRVVMSGFKGEHGITITPSTNVRYYANHITVVSLEFRYACNDENNVVSLYTMDEFNNFGALNQGDLSYFDGCAAIWEATDTNTVVMLTDAADELMNEAGYTCIQEIVDYDGFTDYYVYYKA